MWDVTCPDTFAPLYAALIGEIVDTIADRAEDLEKLKYQDITISHHFILIAIETSGVLGAKTGSSVRTGEAH